MQDGSSGRRKFDQEFKQEAVKLVVDGKRTVADVARSLGVHGNLLHKWKSQYDEDPQSSFTGKGRMKPQDEELKKLQRENANLREEREILKKALAIFSKHPK